ncbi:MAG: ribose-phosphate diphosphokinase, partial [Pseudomonas sp.]
DLISTGGTLQRAAHACHAAGARRIFAAAAHGLFTGPGLLLDPLFERILITDSVPAFRLDPDLAARRLTVLDSTALLAAALRPGSFSQWNSLI